MKDDLTILFAANLGPAISTVESFGASTQWSTPRFCTRFPSLRRRQAEATHVRCRVVRKKGQRRVHRSTHRGGLPPKSLGLLTRWARRTGKEAKTKNSFNARKWKEAGQYRSHGSLPRNDPRELAAAPGSRRAKSGPSATIRLFPPDVALFWPYQCTIAHSRDTCPSRSRMGLRQILMPQTRRLPATRRLSYWT